MQVCDRAVGDSRHGVAGIVSNLSFFNPKRYFATVLMNSSVIDLIVNNHYRYVGGASVPAPKYLEIEDIPAVLWDS